MGVGGDGHVEAVRGAAVDGGKWQRHVLCPLDLPQFYLADTIST